jgi:hypothetical protein
MLLQLAQARLPTVNQLLNKNAIDEEDERR